MTEERPLRAWRVTDPSRWNAFVDAARYHAFPQLWEWGQLRIAAGWRPLRLAVGEGDRPRAGVQILLRPLPLLGWHLAYAPRGPIGELQEPRVCDALLRALRRLGREERIATVKVDPEVTRSDPFGAWLTRPPWRPAAYVQPPSTRIIRLGRPLEELRAELRRKHRQYVSKAERDGVGVERFDGSSPPQAVAGALDDFNRIYQLTAARGGFVPRAPSYYERVWRTFAPGGRVRLSFATLGGERVATLLHFTCGERATEASGGMTDAGARARANYLLKWTAIADFQRDGFRVYDLWGLSTGGIAQFKEGFGGETVEYVGAADLALRRSLDRVLRVAVPAYGVAQRTRLRLLGRPVPSGSPVD